MPIDSTPSFAWRSGFEEGRDRASAAYLTILNLSFAGVGSGTPVASIARTLNLCLPLFRRFNLFGDSQGSNGASLSRPGRTGESGSVP